VEERGFHADYAVGGWGMVETLVCEFTWFYDFFGFL
jgi:hypothetical protein